MINRSNYSGPNQSVEVTSTSHHIPRTKLISDINKLKQQHIMLTIKVEKLCQDALALVNSDCTLLEIPVCRIDYWSKYTREDAHLDSSFHEIINEELTVALVKAKQYIDEEEAQINQSLNQSPQKHFACLYPINDAFELNILLNAFVSALRDVRIALLQAEQHLANLKAPTPYSQQLVQELGIKPMPNQTFRFTDYANNQRIDDLHALAGNQFLCAQSNTVFTVSKDGSLFVRYCPEGAGMDTFVKLICHQADQLNWHRITLNAECELHHRLTQALEHTPLSEIIQPFEPNNHYQLKNLHCTGRRP